ncbi:putative GRX1-glutaredoxin [Serendipita vermifera]|nr:putative GRX1-glutaredoxin [Serendipita vermifera]
MGSSASSLPSTSSKPPMVSQVKQLVDSAIDENFITIFSKSWCPYCRRAKGIINSLQLPEGKSVKVFELDERDDGADIQNYLREKTYQSTVPNIFINKQHIGGSDDLAAAQRSGKLAKLIAAPPA